MIDREELEELCVAVRRAWLPAVKPVTRAAIGSEAYFLGIAERLYALGVRTTTKLNRRSSDLNILASK